MQWWSSFDGSWGRSVTRTKCLIIIWNIRNLRWKRPEKSQEKHKYVPNDVRSGGQPVVQDWVTSILAPLEFAIQRNGTMCARELTGETSVCENVCKAHGDLVRTWLRLLVGRRLCSLCGGVVLIFVVWRKEIVVETLLLLASEAAHRKWLASAWPTFERELNILENDQTIAFLWWFHVET